MVKVAINRTSKWQNYKMLKILQFPKATTEDTTIRFWIFFRKMMTFIVQVREMHFFKAPNSRNVE